MTLQNVVDMAKYGELNNLSLKTNNEAIISYINQGMIELYKIFPLSTKEIIITLGEDGTVDNPYIKVSDDIYTLPNDFMWITAAYDEVPEDSLDIVSIIPINEEDNPFSINTINYNQIQVPVTVTGAYISIIYVSAPPAYTVSDLNTEIALPPQMVEPLLLFVGYKGHMAVSGVINSENDAYLLKFRNSCDQIKYLGMYSSDDVAMTDRVSDRSFV